MKVIVVGCTHAGTAAILNTAKLYPDADITVYEKNDNISFLSCGIALYVGDVVTDPSGLFYCSPEKLAELGVKTRMQHEVLSIDTEKKTMQVKDLQTGKTFDDNYDKLVMTTGSWPIVPAIEGIELDNILLSKNFTHANDIIEHTKTAQNITVIGAGYIGVELVEAFNEQGKNVTLIDAQTRIMAKYLDSEFTDLAEEAFTAHGVHLALGEFLTGFKGENGKVKTVCTDKSCYDTDLVILCIGFRPETELLKGKIDMLKNGAIITDKYMRTSEPDIFAAGDSCAVINNVTGKYTYLPLATNAVRMGTLVAKNLTKATLEHLGTQGTSGIKIYEHNIASTGLTEDVAISEGFDVKTAMITDNHRPEFMPTFESVTVKLVYDANNRRLLGAQIASHADMTQFINTISVCLQNKMTIDQLAYVDFFFQPHFNKPWNLLNTAALSAE